MGRKAPRRVYSLDFSDTEWGKADADGDALIVKMTGASVDESIESTELEESIGSQNMTTARAAMNRMMDILAGHIVSWNLEDEGGSPFAPTRAAIGAQDPLFIQAIMKAYRTAVTGVGEGNGSPSNGGGQSVEQSIPMEPSSPNQLVSPEPSSSSPSATDSTNSPVKS